MISIAVDRVIRAQESGTDRSPEDMHDRQWPKSGHGDDRSFHKTCRGRALHNCLSRRDMRSSEQYMDSKIWMTNDIPIGQWNIFRKRTYRGAHGTFSSSSGSFYDVSSANKWLAGKTKLDSGVDVEGVLFPIHD